MRHVRKKSVSVRRYIRKEGGFAPPPFPSFPLRPLKDLVGSRLFPAGRGKRRKKCFYSQTGGFFSYIWGVGSTALSVCYGFLPLSRRMETYRYGPEGKKYLWRFFVGKPKGGRKIPPLPPLLSLSFLPSSDPNLGLEKKREENGPSTSSSLLLPSPTNANHVFTPSGPRLKNCPPSSSHSRSHMDNAKNIPFCLSPFSCESAILGSFSSSSSSTTADGRGERGG